MKQHSPLASSTYNVQRHSPLALATREVFELEQDRSPPPPRPSLSTCQAVGDGLRGHALGQTANFWIFASDDRGRSCFRGGDAFTVSIRGPSRVNPIVCDNSDGTYAVQWAATVTGTYMISVLLHGEHIRSSPVAAKVVPPCLDPLQCKVVAPSGSISGCASSSPPRAGTDTEKGATTTTEVHAVAGRPAPFDITFNDALGRPVTMESSRLRLSVTSFRSLQDALDCTEASAVRVGGCCNHPSGKNNIEQEKTEDATAPPSRLSHLTVCAEPPPLDYEPHRRRVSVIVDKSGVWDLHVVMREPNGRHTRLTRGSPIRLLIRPDQPSAVMTRCLAKPAEQSMLAGQSRAFVVSSYDIYNNKCDQGGACVQLGGACVDTGDVTYVTTDHGNGEYTVEWRSRVAGVHDVLILLNGRPLANADDANGVIDEASSPTPQRHPIPRDLTVRLLVQPNSVCVTTTSVSGDGLARAIAGEVSIIHVHAKDQCGNPALPLSGVDFVITLWDEARQQAIEVTDDPTLASSSAVAGGRPAPCQLTLTTRWLAHGVRELAYTCSASGVYSLAIWYAAPDGKTLTALDGHEAPHTLEVSPNAAQTGGSIVTLDAPLSEYLSPGPHGGSSLTLMAGSLLSATVQVGDRFANPTAPTESGELRIVLTGPSGVRDITDASAQNAAEERRRRGVRKATLGLFVVREALTSSGVYTLSATLRGEQIQQSPLTSINVQPAPMEGEHSVLVPPPTAYATRSTIALVHCRDRFGNATVREELEAAIASGAIAARVDGGPAKPSMSLSPHEDGSVELDLHFQISGTYRLNVWVGGIMLPRTMCPHTMHVQPPPLARDGELEPSNSPAEASSPVARQLTAPTSPPPQRSYAPTSPPRSPRLSTTGSPSSKVSPTKARAIAASPRTTSFSHTPPASPRRQVGHDQAQLKTFFELTRSLDRYFVAAADPRTPPLTKGARLAAAERGSPRPAWHLVEMK